MLEKIRLVHTSEGERNFHIFYMMLAGTSREERRAWHLAPDPRIYHYINQSNCYDRRDGVMDADLWAELIKAMKVRYSGLGPRLSVTSILVHHVFALL